MVLFVSLDVEVLDVFLAGFAFAADVFLAGLPEAFLAGFAAGFVAAFFGDFFAAGFADFCAGFLAAPLPAAFFDEAFLAICLCLSLKVRRLRLLKNAAR
ncbi:MAG: hypothetical protein IPK87_11670 [Planctomycetes bacterium]|nr:hypothetical protein [Planctomycetota bacterium]